MLQKVEICGVDTSGLPLLTAKENEELMRRLKRATRRLVKNLLSGICGLSCRWSNGFGQRMQTRTMCFRRAASGF